MNAESSTIAALCFPRKAHHPVVVKIPSRICSDPGGTGIKASNASVSRRNHGGSFDHQNNGSLRRARPMHYTFWHDEALSWLQFYNSTFQIDDEQSFHNIKELVFLVMFVPVIFALNDSETNN